MDSIQVARWQGKYQSLSPPLRWILVSVYTTQIPKNYFFLSICHKMVGNWTFNAWFWHRGEYYSLLISEFTNQHALKAPINCVVYTNYCVIFHELFMKKTLNKNSCLRTKCYGVSRVIQRHRVLQDESLEERMKKKELESYDKMILDLGGSGG